MKYFIAVIISRNGKFLVKEINGKVNFPIFEFEKNNGYLLKTLFRVLEEEMNIIPSEIFFVKRITWKNGIVSIYYVKKFRGKVKKNFVWMSKEKLIKDNLSFLSIKIFNEIEKHKNSIINN